MGERSPWGPGTFSNKLERGPSVEISQFVRLTPEAVSQPFAIFSQLWMQGKGSPPPRTALSHSYPPEPRVRCTDYAWREGSACDTKITAYLRVRVLLTFEVDQRPVQARKSVRPTFRAPPDLLGTDSVSRLLR
ncbi:hypothetical protein H112_06835 [Trichophyton rubrum D6]|uniref:Uncharacterized protein n=2 Tax=Trichophyton TaxID=5550 RepID=A0A022VUA1_TRIRU|nr:hypothetical protein H100_06859 [Trichophyton rubrum MR850]EZF39069.1 hypothetical protein H102_06819 [Trichophyton rubrum CBS 100081]EZF49635.1 hypothetical protein H103_06844 [Trichophyton rubrum CBS 288.86]EZF60346.1 hypothetical protein H104_06797 [Trichophyton rubrum CBS 289.86]EZF70944.1 hypothetical protein H105_06860 [Trichophyton soudanense CBS 452.61]EZF81620.1 hypothetical protein H110_06838 [Trichophyton rubrum MR1448]EZF92285.1 hypothetical protein H113_06891 [Trichophyton rub